jgi:hypothetical protein
VADINNGEEANALSGRLTELVDTRGELLEVQVLYALEPFFGRLVGP